MKNLRELEAVNSGTHCGLTTTAPQLGSQLRQVIARGSNVAVLLKTISRKAPILKTSLQQRTPVGQSA
jgi:hypothetical protein